MRYDPGQAPDGAAWLALGESERMDAVARAHRAAGLQTGDSRRDRLHSMAHLVVENQVAAGDPAATVTTLRRLLAAGVDRHSAVHAIGAAVMEWTQRALAEKKPFDEAWWKERLDSIDAAEWLVAAPPPGPTLH